MIDDTIQKMKKILATAQERRDKREDWEEFERATMIFSVNAERNLRGLPFITVKEFIKIENQAVGHSDYTNKLAIYCAWMAEGREDLYRNIR